jgi:hypothetical protein
MRDDFKVQQASEEVRVGIRDRRAYLTEAVIGKEQRVYQARDG